MGIFCAKDLVFGLQPFFTKCLHSLAFSFHILVRKHNLSTNVQLSVVFGYSLGYEDLCNQFQYLNSACKQLTFYTKSMICLSVDQF